jgi:hypothetical protein
MSALETPSALRYGPRQVPCPSCNRSDYDNSSQCDICKSNDTCNRCGHYRTVRSNDTRLMCAVCWEESRVILAKLREGFRLARKLRQENAA